MKKKIQKKDNRKYVFDINSHVYRDEYSIISDLINNNSKIIDLGCGDGSLIEYVKERKNVDSIGIEIASSGVKAAKVKGLQVTQGKIDQILPYNNNEFDYAICNVTLQMVMNPEILIKEMVRISKYQ